MTPFDPAARTEERHIANQKPHIQPSAMRMCYGHKCRNGAGQYRSLRQFCNADLEPVYKFCRLCRGKK